MKLFYRKLRNGLIRMGGCNVKFVNNVAEVSDTDGANILALKLPGLYEDGKQPVFETPKEIKMQADFSVKEAWYKGEIERLINTNESRKTRIKELEVEVANWKAEYAKMKEQNAKLLKDFADQPEAEQPAPEAEPAPQPEAEPVPEAEQPVAEAQPADETNDEIFDELMAMTKGEMLNWAATNNVDIPKAIQKKAKAEIAKYIVDNI